jgi:hypothetical protein
VTRLRGFGRFWYDFIVGDDWIVAAWVVVVIASTAIMARRLDVWPFVPVAVAAALVHSLWRATRVERRQQRQSRTRGKRTRR